MSETLIFVSVNIRSKTMRIIISLIVFLLTMAGLRAADRINFFHIGLEQGLSQSTVVDIIQDKRENMWIATHNGLNRYDGYDFTVYHHNDADTSSIASDVIRSLALDESGKYGLEREPDCLYIILNWISSIIIFVCARGRNSRCWMWLAWRKGICWWLQMPD